MLHVGDKPDRMVAKIVQMDYLVTSYVYLDNTMIFCTLMLNDHEDR